MEKILVSYSSRLMLILASPIVGYFMVEDFRAGNYDAFLFLFLMFLSLIGLLIAFLGRREETEASRICQVWLTLFTVLFGAFLIYETVKERTLLNLHWAYLYPAIVFFTLGLKKGLVLNLFFGGGLAFSLFYFDFPNIPLQPLKARFLISFLTLSIISCITLYVINVILKRLVQKEESLKDKIEEYERAKKEVVRQNALFSGINKVLREALLCQTDEEVAHKCLGVAMELTGSKMGFIGNINPSNSFDSIAMSDTGWEACKLPKSEAVKLVRDMEIKGIWGRVVKDGQPLIANDPASHPDRVGVPEDHPKLSSFLGIPLKESDRTIGLFGLANKDSGYNQDDQKDMEILSVAFGEALNRKWADMALLEAHQNLEEKVERRTRALQESEDQLQASLKEKDVLLREIHHRVKNNLQTISSLLSLQSGQFKDVGEVRALDEVRDRIRVMAIVHEKLYQSQDLGMIDVRGFISEVTQSLLFSHVPLRDKIQLEMDMEQVALNIDSAIPLGLITQELVSNSLKHAFPQERLQEKSRNKIRISLRREEEKGLELIFKDNGVGIPQYIDFKNTNTLGLQLVDTLVRQLHGTMELKREGGTEFRIIFGEMKSKVRV